MEEVKKPQQISRNWDGSPTIFNNDIEEDCLFDNTLIEGYGTIILDKEFIKEINDITDKYDVSKDLVRMFNDVTNMVIDYFFSKNVNDNNRKETYGKNYVTDEDGMIIGTKMSSLKGMNIAECSEKSIVGYMILHKLFSEGKIKSKPSLMLSTLKTENSGKGPHAFILIDREHDEFPVKHILFDINNLSQIEIDGTTYKMSGLYALTDEEHEDLIQGIEISPTSLFDYAGPDFKDVGEKRVFGSKEKNKTI
jgi:hypothetical protein